MWYAAAQAADSLQLGVVQEGLQVRPCELLRRCSKLLKVHICSQGDATAKSLQDLYTILLWCLGYV